MKIFDRFKHRKPGVYISLGVYVLLIFVIIFESCLRSDASGLRSKFIADISAWFINLINGPQKVEVIKPNGIGEVTDTSLLGTTGDKANIAIGTTTMLSVGVKYPAKKNKDDTLDKTFTITPVVGNSEDYNLIQSVGGDKNSFTVIVRIVANKMTSDSYQFDINLANNIKYEYKFRIVDLPAPVDYEAKVEKTSLKIGETTTIQTMLTGSRGKDDYYRRYYDVSKLARSSDNEGVATVDQYGVIHGKSQGSATITYGTKSFNITVTNESIAIPTSNEINLAIDPSSNSSPCLLDYDYVYDGTDNPNQYSTLIYPTFTDLSLVDQSVSWELDNNLKAKIGPYKYDESGYPVYKDDLGRSCVRVSGYREKGTVQLKCVSNADNNVFKTINLNVTEAIATAMEIKSSTGSYDVKLGDQIILSATFTPKNTRNTSINVTASGDVTISNNGTGSVIIKPNSVGSFTLTVKSVSNPSLGDTVTLNVTAKQVINDDNYADFSSFMRKFAGHMGLFLVTAISGFIFFYQFFNDKKKRILWAIGCTLGAGIIIAGISEFIQYFVPTRSGQIKDVGIDTIGTVFGVLICALIWLIIYIIKKYKNKNNKDPQ